uniref:Uncharacterized protein n=1 Tax=Avena sativa TaxID=4498 RepID=A0ACD5WG84_AVESA
MLQAGTERPLALPAGRLWVPGMGPYGGASPSARALEIARRREEMLGMLHGLPESEYELSLTDLVEKTATAGAGNNAGVAHPLPLPPPPPPSERKEAGQPSPLGRPAAPTELSESGRQAEQPAVASKRGSSRRRGDSGSGGVRSSFRSSSDGVLLNFYMPRSFTRSFTAPRPSACARAPSVSTAAAIVVPEDSNKRERDSDTVKCWLMPWDRRWRKSSRRDQAGESAAILRSSAPAEEKV